MYVYNNEILNIYFTNLTENCGQIMIIRINMINNSRLPTRLSNQNIHDLANVKSLYLLITGGMSIVCNLQDFKSKTKLLTTSKLLH